MPSHDEHPAHEALASAARYYKSRGSSNPVVYVQEEAHWRVYADGRLTRESGGEIPAPILAHSEEIGQAEAEGLIELERARAEVAEAERAEARRAQQEQARESARFNAVLLTVVLLVLALVLVAGVLGYLYIGMPSVDADDLLSAMVYVEAGGDRDVQVDLTDPAMREEIAGLLNGLARWCGREMDCVPNARLEVELRRGGPAYCVWLYCNDALRLWIGGSDPDHERRSIWVRSGDMKRFLEEYLDQ